MLSTGFLLQSFLYTSLSAGRRAASGSRGQGSVARGGSAAGVPGIPVMPPPPVGHLPENSPKHACFGEFSGGAPVLFPEVFWS